MIQTGLWSYRWGVARGWRWTLERWCMDSTKNDWLAVYQADEPSIIFKLSYSRPTNKPVNV